MSTIRVEDKDFHSLIEKLNNGDEKAFEELYKRCCSSISFLCQKFCDNKEDAEEVVQDTFVIAFKKAAYLRSDTLLAYLRKIAVHECFKKRDKNRLRHEFLVYSDSTVEDRQELDKNLLPEDALQNKEFQTELLRIINQLPKNRREMIYLYYYANFNTEEIACLYECTNSTVWNTLSAARKTIKSKLEDTESKYTVKGRAFIPLTDIFVFEEQVFSASYIQAAAPTIATANVAGTVAAGTAKSIKGYIIAACAVAACSVFVAVHVASLSIIEGYEPEYDLYAERSASEEEPYIIYEPEDYEVETELQAIELYEMQAEEEHHEPQAEEERTTEDEPYDSEPEPEQVRTEDYEPTDRTPEILAALAAADNAEEAGRIIGYYGFAFAAQIHLDMRYRFYALDDGSGDILIGIATDADGTSWRMRFEHFVNGKMPTDILQRLQFMEQ